MERKRCSGRTPKTKSQLVELPNGGRRRSPEAEMASFGVSEVEPSKGLECDGLVLAWIGLVCLVAGGCGKAVLDAVTM